VHVDVWPYRGEPRDVWPPRAHRPPGDTVRALRPRVAVARRVPDLRGARAAAVARSGQGAERSGDRIDRIIFSLKYFQ
jgi:hypothetical protein